MVAAAEGTRALDRIDVLGRLDDAQDRFVATRVAADRTETVLGEAEALGTRPDPRARLLDRAGQLQRIALRHPQKVHGKALRGAAPDTRQTCQLADERLGRGRQHAG